LKNLLSAGLVIGGLLFLGQSHPDLQSFSKPGFEFFLPGLLLIFLINYFLSLKFLKIIDQPPLMIYLVSMVIKMLMSLALFLVYLLKGFGPANQGAFVFILIYLIFEILEIKRFLSILRPDSRERKPE
jgi:hypothetical protein